MSEPILLDAKSARSDEEILVLSAERPNLFEILVDRYEEAFLRKAQSILRTKEDAEDIVQEAFVKVYLNARRFKVQEGASFKSWAYKILINSCLTKVKRLNRDRSRLAIDDDPEFIEHLPDASFGTTERRRLDVDEFLSVLSRIPVTFQRLLKRSVLDGQSSEQIAKEEAASVGAIRTRLHRAKKEFQKVSSMMKNVIV